MRAILNIILDWLGCHRIVGMPITLELASKQFALMVFRERPGNIDYYTRQGAALLIFNGFPENYEDRLTDSIEDFGERIIAPLVAIYLEQ